MPKGRAMDYAVQSIFGKDDVGLPPGEYAGQQKDETLMVDKRNRKRKRTVIRRAVKGKLSKEFGEGGMSY